MNNIKNHPKVKDFEFHSLSIDDLGLLASSYLTQLTNELYLYNLNDCLYYGYQVVDHVTLALEESSNVNLF